MIGSLLALLIVIIVVGIVAWLVIWLIDTIPLPAPFGQMARVLVILIAVLIILFRALPLIGVSL